MAIGYTKVGGTVYEIGGSGAMVLTKTKIKTLTVPKTGNGIVIGTAGEFAEYDGVQFVYTVNGSHTTGFEVRDTASSSGYDTLLSVNNSAGIELNGTKYSGPIHWKIMQEYNGKAVDDTYFLIRSHYSEGVRDFTETSKLYCTGPALSVDVYGYKFA